MAEIVQNAKSRAIRITSIVRKELKALISDKAAITILFLVPITLLTILGTSAPSISESRVWIVDLDQTEKTQEFISTMKNKTDLEMYATGDLAPIEPEIGQHESDARAYVSLELANETIRTTYLDAYIVLPEGFTESLAENGTTNIQIYYDSIDFLNRFISETFITLGLTNVQLDNLLFESDVYAIPEIRPEEYNQFTEVDTLQ